MKPRSGSLPRKPAVDQKSSASDQGAAAGCAAAAAAAAGTDVLAGRLHVTFEKTTRVWRAMSSRASPSPSTTTTLDMNWAGEGSAVLQMRAISAAITPVAPAAVASIVLPLPKMSRACK